MCLVSWHHVDDLPLAYQDQAALGHIISILLITKARGKSTKS